MDGTELAISGCLGLLLLIAIIWLYRCSGRRLALPDVPRVTGVVPWLGCGLQFVGNPRKFLEDTQKKVSLCSTCPVHVEEKLLI